MEHPIHSVLAKLSPAERIPVTAARVLCSRRQIIAHPTVESALPGTAQYGLVDAPRTAFRSIRRDLSLEARPDAESRSSGADRHGT